MLLSQACAARFSAAYPRQWVCSTVHPPLSRKSSSIPPLKLPHYEDYSTNDINEQRKAWRSVSAISVRRVKQKSGSNPALVENAHLINGSLEETLHAHKQANETTLKILKIKSNAADDQRVAPTETLNSGWRRLRLERSAEQPDAGKTKEYEGHSRPLLIEWRPAESLPYDLRFPWMRELGEHVRDDMPSMTRLNMEIQAADAYFSPSPAEHMAANVAIQDIRELVAKCSPTAVKIDVIGSRANGLAHPLSDIDVNVVVVPETESGSSRKTFAVLSELYRQMRYGRPDAAVQKLVVTQYFAASARVPIIAAIHLPSGLEFQIQSASSGYGSLEYCKGLAAEFPTLSGLFKIIKQMLNIRGLCVGVSGGITSYPLLNMIATSLKIHESKTEDTDAARQLVQFLDFFSELNFYERGITYRPSAFLKSELGSPPETMLQKRNDIQDLVAQDPVGAVPLIFDVRSKLGSVHLHKDNFMMTLYDPANLDNDLGKSVRLIKHIQATFLDVRVKLAAAMEEWDARSGRLCSETQRPMPLLESLVGADYSTFNLERKGLLNTAEKRKLVRRVRRGSLLRD